MASDEERDTSRAVMKTYVPAYQKEAWREHADDLGMSQSEFIRSMVQAGRRGFLDDEQEPANTDDESEQATNTAGDLESRVQAVLTADEYHSWDELVAAITDNIEDRLEATLADLQDENSIRYSGRNGGYTLVKS